MVFRRQSRGFGNYDPRNFETGNIPWLPPDVPPQGGGYEPGQYIGQDMLGSPEYNYQYTPGTPGAPDYQPPVSPPLSPGYHPVDPNSGLFPTATVPTGDWQAQGPASGGFIQNILQNLPGGPGMAQPVFTGGGDPTGQFTQSQLGQNITGDMMNYALLNPEIFGMLYANETGANMNGGNFALSQQYAGNMPTEYLMTPYANDMLSTADDRAAWMEQNIQQGQTPGASYFTTGDFLSQAFNPGSAMYQHIWGGGGSEALLPQQQLSNFFSAMEAVVGPQMGEEMMNVWGSRYMASFDQYLIHLAQGGQDMSLADWFTSQGLGLPQGQ
jgi:hypothetical protein